MAPGDRLVVDPDDRVAVAADEVFARVERDLAPSPDEAIRDAGGRRRGRSLLAGAAVRAEGVAESSDRANDPRFPRLVAEGRRSSMTRLARLDSDTCVAGHNSSWIFAFATALGRLAIRISRSAKAFGESATRRPSRRTSRVSESKAHPPNANLIFGPTCLLAVPSF